MPDVSIVVTIPADKVAKAVEGFFYLHPIPTNPGGDPIYTQVQWFKEWLRKKIVTEVARGLQKKARDAATFDLDEDVAA